MNTYAIIKLALLTVAVLWISASISRSAASRYLHSMIGEYRAYYASHGGEAGEAPPPVEWDYRSGKLVPIAPERIEVRGDQSELTTVQVRQDAMDVPFWVRGLWIGRIPARWLHVPFAVLTMLLGFILFRLRP